MVGLAITDTKAGMIVAEFTHADTTEAIEAVSSTLETSFTAVDSAVMAASMVEADSTKVMAVDTAKR